jgi:hypothetical protein
VVVFVVGIGGAVCVCVGVVCVGVVCVGAGADCVCEGAGAGVAVVGVVAEVAGGVLGVALLPFEPLGLPAFLACAGGGFLAVATPGAEVVVWVAGATAGVECEPPELPQPASASAAAGPASSARLIDRTPVLSGTFAPRLQARAPRKRHLFVPRDAWSASRGASRLASPAAS